MSLTRQKTLDKVEIVGEYKRLQARYKTSILENGELLSEAYNYVAYDVDYGIENLDVELQPYVNGIWTAELIADYKSYLSSLNEAAE